MMDESRGGVKRERGGKTVIFIFNYISSDYNYILLAYEMFVVKQ